MSNANESEFHELEPLEELHELEPLPESAPAAAGAGVGAAAASSAPAVGGGEQTPLMIQKAGLALTFAALLPWLVPEGFELVRMGAKVVILLGGWFLYCGIEHASGGKTPLDALGKAHKLALPSLAYLLMLVGVFLTLLAKPLDEKSGLPWQGMIEASALAVGVIAWCQVHGYVRTGKFNPMIALVIPMFGLAALINVVVALGLDVPGLTMYLGIKSAKAHGEAMKRAAVEARAQERRRKRGEA
jgi:hypothetical protein